MGKEKAEGGRKTSGKSNAAKSEPQASTQANPASPRQTKTLPADFSLDTPDLPDDIEKRTMRSGNYPYDKRIKRESYEKQLLTLQIELVKLQIHNIKTRDRILILYEGRDGAGKGSCINAFRQHLNPRNTRAVALPKPTESERGQLYYQRYVTHLPTWGEMVLFDRSWYNRAGVERVMGFCDENQLATFLRETPTFEQLLVRDGIRFFKFYLSIGREMQIKRFHERRHNPLKQWKLSDVDIAALNKWDDYTLAAEEMFRFTHTINAPWQVVLANDQRRARLETIRAVLLAIPYEGRDLKVIGEADPQIIGSGEQFFDLH
jgi:polyphosphate kinase